MREIPVVPKTSRNKYVLTMLVMCFICLPILTLRSPTHPHTYTLNLNTLISLFNVNILYPIADHTICLLKQSSFYTIS